MSETISLSEFWDELNKHDWYYHYSDDFRVWKSGHDDSQRLKKIAEQSIDHAALMANFADHKFSGDTYGKPQVEKPERPA